MTLEECVHDDLPVGQLTLVPQTGHVLPGMTQVVFPDAAQPGHLRPGTYRRNCQLWEDLCRIFAHTGRSLCPSRDSKSTSGIDSSSESCTSSGSLLHIGQCFPGMIQVIRPWTAHLRHLRPGTYQPVLVSKEDFGHLPTYGASLHWRTLAGHLPVHVRWKPIVRHLQCSELLDTEALDIVIAAVHWAHGGWLISG